MARALSNPSTLSTSDTSARTTSVYKLGLLRLASGSLIVLGAFVTLLGTAWDIQWHVFVGRDRTLIPPHVMDLTGIAVCGLVALIAVIVETIWIRRTPTLGLHATHFADIFSGSLGAYITGFAALNAAIAFPLDAYWHSIYGIDVSIWEPFHVMILVAAACMPLGGAYMLASGTRLVSGQGDRRTALLGRIGIIIGLATAMSIFTYLLPNALGKSKYIALGPVLLCVFPLLSALLISWTFSAVTYALSGWRAMASAVIAVYVVYALIFQLLVPPLTDGLIVTERMEYQPNVQKFIGLSMIALNFWFLMPIVVAPIFDLLSHWMRRRAIARGRVLFVLAFATLPACFPWVIIDTRSNMLANLAIQSLPAPFSYALGLLPSLLLGFGGALLGIWLGRRTGETMSIADSSHSGQEMHIH